jgi:hypothetical protein
MNTQRTGSQAFILCTVTLLVLVIVPSSASADKATPKLSPSAGPVVQLPAAAPKGLTQMPARKKTYTYLCSPQPPTRMRSITVTTPATSARKKGITGTAPGIPPAALPQGAEEMPKVVMPRSGETPSPGKISGPTPKGPRLGGATPIPLPKPDQPRAEGMFKVEMPPSPGSVEGKVFPKVEIHTSGSPGSEEMQKVVTPPHNPNEPEGEGGMTQIDPPSLQLDAGPPDTD